MLTEKNFITVVCFLWTDQERRRDYVFGGEHVLTLKRMVDRNLTVPHEFVCVCDNPPPADIAKQMGIRFVRLDPVKHVPGTVFVRLMMRKPNIGGVLGRRILCLDLDCVIVGNIDHLVLRPEPSVFWRNPNYGQPGRAFYQTSIQLFTAGSHSELWTDFDPLVTPTWVNRRFGGAEQAWVSERLSWDLPTFADSDGIYGAGRLGGNGVYTELPKDARIVFTPGNREPSQPETQAKHPWIKEYYK